MHLYFFIEFVISFLNKRKASEEPTVTNITRKSAQTSKPSLTPSLAQIPLAWKGPVHVSSGLWHTQFSAFTLLTLQCAVMPEERHTCDGFSFSFSAEAGWWLNYLASPSPSVSASHLCEFNPGT